MTTLSLPRAKYGDSVIIKDGDKLREVIINEVRGEFDEDEKLFWTYYVSGKEGNVSRLFSDDILMNLTIRQMWEENYYIIEN